MIQEDLAMMDGKMIAVVGLGAILPDAHDVDSFWKTYSQTRTP